MKETHRDDGSPFTSPPGRAAVVLLGIYIAMYMATAGIVRVLTVHEAVAANAQHGSTAHPVSASPSALPAGVAESPRTGAPVPVPEQMDSARECNPTATIDSTCLFN